LKEEETLDQNQKGAAQAYPLAWPAAWPRTRHPERSRFDRIRLTIFKCVREIGRQLNLLGARKVVISTNLKLRQDGIPYSNQRQPDDAGVAVYFTLGGTEQCVPCDRWKSIEENLWAISCSIEAMRGLERWGAKSFVDAAFRGFKALPERASGRAWWDVLGVATEAPADEIRAQYRKLAMTHHPDRGGSIGAFTELQDALGQALAARGESR
jgi:hypothetical protein